jgi:hypothetical protein
MPFLIDVFVDELVVSPLLFQYVEGFKLMVK